MCRIITLFVLCCSLSSLLHAAQAASHNQPETLSPYSAEYTASYNGLPISMVRTLAATDEGFSLSTKASNLLGAITEEETLTLNNGQIHPQHYQYQRAIMGKKRRETSTFDPDAQKIVNIYKDETVELAYNPQTLSPLSYQFQMQLDLLHGKTVLNYPVASRGHIKNYQYSIIREETIDTPLGQLDTVVVERQRDSDERETFLWLAPKLQFLPVKLLQNEEGETYKMQIKSYTLQE